MNNATYYQQLEQGARYLASRAKNAAERLEHLGWANRYYTLAEDARTRRSASSALAA
jgi:hypothetical protein